VHVPSEAGRRQRRRLRRLDSSLDSSAASPCASPFRSARRPAAGAGGLLDEGGAGGDGHGGEEGEGEGGDAEEGGGEVEEVEEAIDWQFAQRELAMAAGQVYLLSHLPPVSLSLSLSLSLSFSPSVFAQRELAMTVGQVRGPAGVPGEGVKGDRPQSSIRPPDIYIYICIYIYIYIISSTPAAPSLALCCTASHHICHSPLSFLPASLSCDGFQL
jgi:hypothetical protein